MNMNMQFQFLFFFKKKKTKSVSHTPKLELHIVLNVYIEWKDHTREMRKLVGLGMACSIPPNLVCHSILAITFRSSIRLK